MKKTRLNIGLAAAMVGAMCLAGCSESEEPADNAENAANEAANEAGEAANDAGEAAKDAAEGG